MVLQTLLLSGFIHVFCKCAALASYKKNMFDAQSLASRCKGEGPLGWKCLCNVAFSRRFLRPDRRRWPSLLGSPGAHSIVRGQEHLELVHRSFFFFPVLKATDHRGISITQIVADRAVLEPLQQALLQREEAYFFPQFNPRAGELASLTHLLSWHVSTGCAARNAQNSLKWGLAPHATCNGRNAQGLSYHC